MTRPNATSSCIKRRHAAREQLPVIHAVLPCTEVQGGDCEFGKGDDGEKAEAPLGWIDPRLPDYKVRLRLKGEDGTLEPALPINISMRHAWQCVTVDHAREECGAVGGARVCVVPHTQGPKSKYYKWLVDKAEVTLDEFWSHLFALVKTDAKGLKAAKTKAYAAELNLRRISAGEALAMGAVAVAVAVGWRWSFKKISKGVRWLCSHLAEAL